MALLSWLQKKPIDEDYEQVLASLALSIQTCQTKLSEIRLRERRATLLVTTWAFAGWAAYVGLWWTGVLGRNRGLINSLWGVLVILGPIAVLFTRRIVQLWYARKGKAEENMLKALLTQQRHKIEEIKKKTNYYTTKNLLERYDDEPARRHNPGESPGVQKGGLPASTPSRGPPNPSTPIQGQQRAPQTPVRSGPQGQSIATALSPLLAPQKQWYDKLADAILGDDTASTGLSPASRYALICERCFTHNGLVKEEQWEHAQYICPKCGHFNASVRARRVGAHSAASSAASPISQQSAFKPPRVQEASSGSGPEPPSSPSASGSQPAPTLPELSPNTPLSASTVLVEKDDAEHKDGRRDVAEREGNHDGEAAVDTTVRMEVDS